MEKIYMENNNNNKKNKSFFGARGSVIMSFVVAVAGILSLVAFGFSQVSFAIPDVESPLPDSFTTSEPSDGIVGDNSNFPVFQYSTVDSDGEVIPVYCLEYDVDFCDSTVYQKDSTIINDTGLLYLMANLYPNVELKYNGTAGRTEIQAWLSQTAIWIYLKQSGYDGQTKMTDEKIQAIMSETGLTLNDGSSTGVALTSDVSGVLYDVYKSNELTIKQLVAKALTLKGQVANSLTVTKDSDSISITSDNKYYQTDLISVVGSVSDSSIGSFNGYKITIKNAPSGTIIVDKNGNEISDLTNVTPGTQFYVRVPVDKVTEDNKNVSISIEGSFKSYTGNKYVSGDCQTITAVKTVNNNLSKPLDIELTYTPDVPDTGMNTAQSIYFIGLIVLLSGVGIIYANVKPTESN